ncbi:hypothetical protein D3C81_1991860 [compost metagenome]
MVRTAIVRVGVDVAAGAPAVLFCPLESGVVSLFMPFYLFQAQIGLLVCRATLDACGLLRISFASRKCP